MPAKYNSLSNGDVTFYKYCKQDVLLYFRAAVSRDMRFGHVIYRNCLHET